METLGGPFFSVFGIFTVFDVLDGYPGRDSSQIMMNWALILDIRSVYSRTTIMVWILASNLLAGKLEGYKSDIRTRWQWFRGGSSVGQGIPPGGNDRPDASRRRWPPE